MMTARLSGGRRVKSVSQPADAGPMTHRIAALGLIAAMALACLTGCGPTLPGTSCPMFPADSHWHADVSHLPTLANSTSLVASVGTGSALKADFGSGVWDGGPIGIPYVVVPGTQPKVKVTFE